MKPQLGSLEFAETGNETVAGKVSVKIEKAQSEMNIDLTVPEGSEAVVYIPENYRNVEINDVAVYNKEYVANDVASSAGEKAGYNRFRLSGGNYRITSVY